MYKYKTRDGSKEGFIPGVGAVVDGVIESAIELDSPNLECIVEDTSTNDSATEPPVQPAATNDIEEI